MAFAWLPQGVLHLRFTVTYIPCLHDAFKSSLSDLDIVRTQAKRKKRCEWSLSLVLLYLSVKYFLIIIFNVKYITYLIII